MTAALKDMLLREAAVLGFDAVRVTTPDAVKGAGERLAAFLEAGRHGVRSSSSRIAVAPVS